MRGPTLSFCCGLLLICLGLFVSGIEIESVIGPRGLRLQIPSHTIGTAAVYETARHHLGGSRRVAVVGVGVDPVLLPVEDYMSVIVFSFLCDAVSAARALPHQIYVCDPVVIEPLISARVVSAVRESSSRSDQQTVRSCFLFLVVFLRSVRWFPMCVFV
jgi:hypothetical protein